MYTNSYTPTHVAFDKNVLHNTEGHNLWRYGIQQKLSDAIAYLTDPAGWVDKHWHRDREAHGLIHVGGESNHKAGEWLPKYGYPSLEIAGRSTYLYLNNLSLARQGSRTMYHAICPCFRSKFFMSGRMKVKYLGTLVFAIHAIQAYYRNGCIQVNMCIENRTPY